MVAEGYEMSGYILHETLTRVVIATMESENVKTGNMIQIWILNRNTAPHVAVKTGEDSVVCGNCPHRGTIVDGKLIDRTCYVVTFQGPLSVWSAYHRGVYERITDYSVFSGRMVRLGAYGDPAFIPRRIVDRIVAAADGHTGYTHQWRGADWLRQYVMASVDTLAELETARANGWRTFRVSSTLDTQTGEILCPASDEAGKRTTCEQCGLCNGARDGVKSIMIPVHGRGADKFKILA